MSNLKHGSAKRSGRSPEYRTWENMKARCYQPTSPYYSHYGGSGITVCDAWRHNFSAFLADMGPRPTPSHSIDRIDSTGHYEPSNCRWATTTEQARNTSRCVLLTHDGRTQTISAWAAELGWGHETLRARIAAGWSAERALTTPKGKRRGPMPGFKRTA